MDTKEVIRQLKIAQARFMMVEKQRPAIFKAIKIIKDNEWISVDDSLPDANICVLANVFRKKTHTSPEADFICTAKLNRATRHCGKDSPIDNRWYVFPSLGHELTGSVTHWKPLPEPPK